MSCSSGRRRSPYGRTNSACGRAVDHTVTQHERSAAMHQGCRCAWSRAEGQPPLTAAHPCCKTGFVVIASKLCCTCKQAAHLDVNECGHAGADTIVILRLGHANLGGLGCRKKGHTAAGGEVSTGAAGTSSAGGYRWALGGNQCHTAQRARHAHPCTAGAAGGMCPLTFSGSRRY